MKLSLNTVTIQPAPLFTKIEAASKAGFDGIEFHVYEIFEHLIGGGSMADVRHALADAGLAVPSMLGFRNWGDLQGHDYKLHLFEARRRLRLCANLGCPHLICSTPMYQADWSHLHERYADLLAIGREEGCTPAFEFIGHYASVTNLRDARTMLERADAELAARSASGCSVTLPCLCLDAFHLWNGGSSLDDLRALPANRIAHFHIDDAAPGKPPGAQDDSDRVLPGDGQIDLSGMLAVLRKIGYDKWLSLELFDKSLWQRDPLDVAKLSLERLQALLS